MGRSDNEAETHEPEQGIACGEHTAGTKTHAQNTNTVCRGGMRQVVEDEKCDGDTLRSDRPDRKHLCGAKDQQRTRKISKSENPDGYEECPIGFRQLSQARTEIEPCPYLAALWGTGKCDDRQESRNEGKRENRSVAKTGQQQ